MLASGAAASGGSSLDQPLVFTVTLAREAMGVPLPQVYSGKGRGKSRAVGPVLYQLDRVAKSAVC